jgi:hypothetical protein
VTTNKYGATSGRLESPEIFFFGPGPDRLWGPLNEFILSVEANMATLLHTMSSVFINNIYK